MPCGLLRFFSLFLPPVILLFILDIVTIVLWGAGSCYNLLESVDFCLGSELPWVCSPESQHACCGLWFQSHFHFQKLGCGVCPVCAPTPFLSFTPCPSSAHEPSWDGGGGIHHSLFHKAFSMFFRISSIDVYLRWELGTPYAADGIPLSSFFLLKIESPGFSFLITFTCTFCDCICLPGKQWEGGEREKQGSSSQALSTTRSPFLSFCGQGEEELLLLFSLSLLVFLFLF